MVFTRIVLVTKRTPYEELLATYGTHGQAAFLLTSRGQDISSFRVQHDQYCKAVQTVEGSLPKDVSHTLVERRNIPLFLFRGGDLIVAIGPDGLFANLAKYLSGQPVVAVNPLPGVIDGVVMRHRPMNLADVIKRTLADDVTLDEVALAEAKTDEGESILAVNDFLVGRLDHISARYHLSCGYGEEHQSSSGVLISTGMGSSGWLRSIKAAVNAANEEGEILIPEDPTWDEERLVFVVREPFPSRATGTEVVFGDILPDEPLEIISEMPEGGVVFSDGVPEDSLALPAGIKLTIGIAEKKAILVRP